MNDIIVPKKPLYIVSAVPKDKFSFQTDKGLHVVLDKKNIRSKETLDTLIKYTPQDTFLYKLAEKELEALENKKCIGKGFPKGLYRTNTGKAVLTMGFAALLILFMSITGCKGLATNQEYHKQISVKSSFVQEEPQDQKQEDKIIQTTVNLKQDKVDINNISDIVTNAIREESKKVYIENQKKETNNSSVNTSVRREVSLEEVLQGKVMVVLTFGQSQAANYGESRYSSRENVYNFNFKDGKFYTAVDPLLGTSGNKGSVWTRLGDKIIQQGLYDSVLLVPIAVGATTIDRWTPNGDLYYRLPQAINGLRQYNLEITHILWHQGSADAWLHSQQAAEQYKANFMSIVNGIRGLDVNAPIYVAISTYSYGNSDSLLQQAQRDLANPDLGIYPGPDGDVIPYRWDGVHFSNMGLDQLANGWLHCLVHYP